MDPAPDLVTITLPRTVLSDVVAPPAEMMERMHELLERNTDGALSLSEAKELESLVRITEFGQIVAMALALG